MGWKEALPIALLCTSIAPKEQIGLSPYGMLYVTPLVYVNDFFLDPETETLSSYTTAIRQFQQDIRFVRCQPGPKRFFFFSKRFLRVTTICSRDSSPN